MTKPNAESASTGYERHEQWIATGECDEVVPAQNTDYGHNEVWQEADGTCLVYVGGGEWAAFGVQSFLHSDDPSIVKPLRRLLLADGSIAPERLTHNDGSGVTAETQTEGE